MRKSLTILLVFVSALFLITFASAICNLQVSLLNQDPYPAVPGDYVKLVFQVQGTENPDCGNFVFQLVPQYPLSFDPGASSIVALQGGNFVNNYQSSILIPYKVRVDENAVDGDNPVSINYYNADNPSNSSTINQFNLNVKDVRTTFEAYVNNFDSTTNTMTVQILNSGKSNIDALTVEIPSQNNVTVKGSNKNILGSLDANEYTTTDFEVSPAKENINLNIYYTDKIGVRRQTNTTVSFDPASFEGRKTSSSGSSTWIYIVIIIVLIIIYFVYRRYKKNKKRKQLHS